MDSTHSLTDEFVNVSERIRARSQTHPRDADALDRRAQTHVRTRESRVAAASPAGRRSVASRGPGSAGRIALPRAGWRSRAGRF
eukprot:6177359-Pleurochrysis_carterae.AAC.1